MSKEKVEHMEILLADGSTISISQVDYVELTESEFRVAGSETWGTFFVADRSQVIAVYNTQYAKRTLPPK